MLASIINASTSKYTSSFVKLYAPAFWSLFSLVFSHRIMSTFITHRDPSNGLITVTPKNQVEQSGLVVICHGLGDTAEGFLDVAERLASQMPHVKFVLPTAPTQPVAMNMNMPMPSWYDITGLDERSNEVCNGIEQSRNTLIHILDTEHSITNLPYHRMVLAGFSQGAALSLYTGMQLPHHKRPAGIVMLSGYLPNSKVFRITSGLEDLPVLHCHGTADPMVQFAMALKTQQHLTLGEKGTAATNYTLKKYEGLQHTVSIEELEDLQLFLVNVLPLDVESECKVRLKDPGDMTVIELKMFIRNAGLESRARGLMEKHEFVKLVRDHRVGNL